MLRNKAMTKGAVAVLALIAASGAGAQTSSAAAPAEEQAGGIADIVVTARKISESAQSVPLSIVALGGEALKNANIVNVQDLQSQVPNLILQTHPVDPQSLSLAMRGQKQVDLTLTLDPSVGLYVDGFYNPRSIGLRGALVDMERVEVLRGPQGTLYGRNTTGGALALYTKDPTDQVEGSVDLTLGSHNAWDIQGVANTPLGENLAIRVVAQHSAHDGYGVDGLGNPLLKEKSSYIRGKVKAGLGERVTVTLSGSWTDSRNSGAIVQMANLRPPSNGGAAVSDFSTIVRAAAAELGLTATVPNLRTAYDQLLTYVGGVNGDIYRTGGTFAEASNIKVYTGGLDVVAELNDAITLRSLTGIMQLKRFARTDTDGTPFNLVGGPRTTRDKYYSQELQLLGSSETINWVLGAYYGNERGRDITVSDTVPAISPTSPTIFDATVRNRSVAVFGQAVWEFMPSWRLTAGARYSWDRRILISSNSNRTNACVVPAPGVTIITAVLTSRQCPRTFVDKFAKPSFLLSLDHEFSDGVLGYAKLARGYRSGGRNFKGSNNIGTFIDFDPEVVTEYEVGLKSYLFDRRLRLNLAAYYDSYDDVQRVATITLPGTTALSSQTVNAAKARIQGLEADLLWRVTSAFTLNAAAGMTDAKYKTFIDLTGDRSNEPFDVPKWTANVGGRYAIPTSAGELALQVDYQWQDKLYLDPQAYKVIQFTQPSRGLLGARLSLNIDAWDARVSLFGKNITGKKYYSSGASPYTSLGYSFAVVGEPSQVGIQFSKKFGGN